MSIIKLLTSSVGRKILMAITGLLLAFFMAFHLFGNLFKPFWLLFRRLGLPGGRQGGRTSSTNVQGAREPSVSGPPPSLSY